MASKRVTKLKWTRNKHGVYRWGPFSTQSITREVGYGCWLVYIHFDDCVASIKAGSLTDAKRACEKLASRILGAMKP